MAMRRIGLGDPPRSGVGMRGGTNAEPLVYNAVLLWFATV